MWWQEITPGRFSQDLNVSQMDMFFWSPLVKWALESFARFELFIHHSYASLDKLVTPLILTSLALKAQILTKSYTCLVRNNIVIRNGPCPNRNSFNHYILFCFVHFKWREASSAKDLLSNDVPLLSGCFCLFQEAVICKTTEYSRKRRKQGGHNKPDLLGFWKFVL